MMQLTNYSSIDGVLYCKPHYDQLFKMTGSLDKSFEGTSTATSVLLLECLFMHINLTKLVNVGVMKHRAERSNGHEVSYHLKTYY